MNPEVPRPTQGSQVPQMPQQPQPPVAPLQTSKSETTIKNVSRSTLLLGIVNVLLGILGVISLIAMLNRSEDPTVKVVAAVIGVAMYLISAIALITVSVGLKDKQQSEAKSRVTFVGWLLVGIYIVSTIIRIVATHKFSLGFGMLLVFIPGVYFVIIARRISKL